MLIFLFSSYTLFHFPYEHAFLTIPNAFCWLSLALSFSRPLYLSFAPSLLNYTPIILMVAYWCGWFALSSFWFMFTMLSLFRTWAVFVLIQFIMLIFMCVRPVFCIQSQKKCSAHTPMQIIEVECAAASQFVRKIRRLSEMLCIEWKRATYFYLTLTPSQIRVRCKQYTIYLLWCIAPHCCWTLLPVACVHFEEFARAFIVGRLIWHSFEHGMLYLDQSKTLQLTLQYRPRTLS